MNTPHRPTDADRVRDLLGREPRGVYEIVVRDASGDPIVLRNAPFLDDGTPMPTLYWLIGPGEIRRIGQLESRGGVDAAESEIDAAEIAAAHDRYAAERDADIPTDHVGPRPTGGVGGTRVGLKCLHAHWAWHLAGGDDPVGRWIERRLAADEQFTPTVHIGEASVEFAISSASRAEIPWGVRNLTERWFADDDPPRPEALTNALGTVDDHLDDIVREYPDVARIADLAITGAAAVALGRLEVGHDDVASGVVLTRQAAEEIFRMVATETRDDRAGQPGLPYDAVDRIIATCCIVLTFMRRFRLDQVHVRIDHPR